MADNGHPSKERLNEHSMYGFTINISLALKGRVANHLKSVTLDPRKEGRTK